MPSRPNRSARTRQRNRIIGTGCLDDGIRLTRAVGVHGTARIDAHGAHAAVDPATVVASERNNFSCSCHRLDNHGIHAGSNGGGVRGRTIGSGD
jgi:hypothetical protein